MKRGKFITFEGIDGAGKSTHLNWLIAFLRGAGREVVSTREPGGTPLGEKLRTLLLSESMQPESEALLMFAARAEHLKVLIEPALVRGLWVVSDRFTDASFAYQCGGRGLPESKLSILESWVQEGLQPDLTLLFDVPLDLARERLAGARNEPDRFEREKGEFFARVREIYLKRANESPSRIKLIDSTQPIPVIQKKLQQLLEDHFKTWS